MKPIKSFVTAYIFSNILNLINIIITYYTKSYYYGMLLFDCIFLTLIYVINIKKNNWKMLNVNKSLIFISIIYYLISNLIWSLFFTLLHNHILNNKNHKNYDIYNELVKNEDNKDIASEFVFSFKIRYFLELIILYYIALYFTDNSYNGLLKQKKIKKIQYLNK